jgi:diguanylate cyclase (GGDEF)-like protein
LTISIASYIVSRNAVRDNIAAQELPLTGDNIYSELQKDILRPVFISSLMAHDTFVRDWLLRGERDTSEITRYLAEVKQRYGTLTALLALLFDHSLKQVARTREAMSVVLFDLDHFKAINDTPGHLVGDNVINWVARTVKQTLRDSDVLARWGGEEFLVVLKQCDLAHAMQVGEKNRNAVQSAAFRDKDLTIPLSVSVGVAEYQPKESIDAVLARADKALYCAKQNGRNRVEGGEPPTKSAVT